MASSPFVLEREQIVPRPRAEVFAFFEDAANLDRITPPALRFRILTPMPVAMGEGTELVYRLALFGVPFRWRTRIERYEPGRCFVDRQISGPYRLWRHLHTFEDVAGSDPPATRMRDRVEYEIGFGWLGRLARALFVRRQVEAIFDYRREAIARLLG